MHVSEFASEIVHWNDFHLTNGSGLFGSTRTSIQQMTRLLTFMYAHQIDIQTIDLLLRLPAKMGL